MIICVYFIYICTNYVIICNVLEEQLMSNNKNHDEIETLNVVFLEFRNTMTKLIYIITY